jgi:hypothetical protein
MSQQGPIIVVSNDQDSSSFSRALDDAKFFPIVDTALADASRAVAQLRPAAVLVGPSEVDEALFEALAEQIAAHELYLPLIALNPTATLPENALPFSHSDGKLDRLIARLRAALRVSTLHATLMRRLDDDPAARTILADTDPSHDAVVLLIGRGASYPALSVALGERMGIVGALSIEAAAKHLNVRDIDGIVLGEGFSPRVVDAFLTVLAEDARFRNLPVVVTSHGLVPDYDLPNLEIISGEPAYIANNALPLIRQHAFEALLRRTLRSLDAGGLLDPRTGLLTRIAFERDLAAAVHQTLSRGGELSLARFAFDASNTRSQFNGARILSRLMRQMDFGTLQNDGSVVVAFADADLRTSHGIARRLSSVMRHTSNGKREARLEPAVTIATLLPSDSTETLRARLYEPERRAAS